MKVRLFHRTSYRFAAPAVLGPHIIRLKPAFHTPQPISKYELSVTGVPHELYWQQDPYGNRLARTVFTHETDMLDITVAFEAAVAPLNPFDFLVEPEAARWPFDYAPDLRADLAPLRQAEPAGPRLMFLLDALPRSGTDTVGLLVTLNQRIATDVSHEKRYVPGTFDPDETLALGHASCRDSAWLLVQVLRNLGFAARFVSGYLLKLNEPDGVLRAGLHAWADVFLPGAGWIGLDPSYGLVTAERHIPLAATRHWVQSAPVTGTASVPSELSHDISLARCDG